MTNITEMLEKIDVEKQLLSLMPKNNDKNVTKYLEKIQDLTKEYTKYQNDVEKVLKKRYEKITNVEQSNEIENLDIRLNTIEKTLYLLSDYKTSYEKIELDKIIYKIAKYYKGNLESINEQIEQAIRKFASVGINLQLSDFNYSIYVEQYMETFFKERENGNINFNILKIKFEEVYWKCPDIIIHIELNLRNIYLNKQVQIDKFLEREKNKLLKQWEKTPKEIMNTYLGIKIQKQDALLQDKKMLLDKFLKGELNIDNYAKEKVESNYSKILSNKTDINQEEIEKSILEFLNSLYEYKNYMNFQFIIDDMKKYYKEKDKYKKSYEDTKKKIVELEKKLKKLNKKASGKGFFSKKNKEVKQSAEQNQIILDLKKIYKELDANKFYNKIYTNLGEDSTIYDALNLANSYYKYLTNCMIENNKTITQEKIDEQIIKLNEFINNPFNNIITNLTITDEKDIAMIIKDRYQLLNFNIKPEDLNGKNLDSLITLLQNIVTSFCLKNTGLEVQNIQEMIKIKDTLKI